MFTSPFFRPTSREQERVKGCFAWRDVSFSYLFPCNDPQAYKQSQTQHSDAAPAEIGLKKKNTEDIKKISKVPDIQRPIVKKE